MYETRTETILHIVLLKSQVDRMGKWNKNNVRIEHPQLQ